MTYAKNHFSMLGGHTASGPGPKLMTSLLFWVLASVVVLSLSCGTSESGTVPLNKVTGTKVGQAENGPGAGSAGQKASGVPIWPSFPIPVYVESSFTKSDAGAITAAMATWERALGHKVFLLVGEEGRSQPGVNVISQDSDQAGFAVGGITSYAYTDTRYNGPDGNISSASIHFNSSFFNWKDTMALTDYRPEGDTQSVALHELGHFLGLGHISAAEEPDSVMNPKISGRDGYAKRRLSLLDIERVAKLYGAPAAGEAEATRVYQSQNEVQSISEEDVKAWLLTRDCKNLLAQYGPVADGYYHFITNGDGYDVDQHWDCKSFPANLLAASAVPASQDKEEVLVKYSNF